MNNNKPEGLRFNRRFALKKFRSHFRTILFLAAGLLLLWYVTRDQDLAELWQQIRSANFFWVGLAMFAGLISHILRTLRWNQLIASMNFEPRFKTTFYAVMTGYLMNMVVPRLGEITRCGALHKSENIPFDKLAGTVIAERAFDMICLLILLFTTVLLQFAFLKDFLYKWLVEPLTLKLEGHYMAFIYLGVGGILLAAGMLGLFLFLKKKYAHKEFYKKIVRIIKGFWLGILSIGKIRNKPLFILYSVLIWMFYFFMTYLIFFALTDTSHLGVADGFTLLVTGSLGIVAPVPGGIGAYHFLISTTLVELFAVPQNSAVSFAYLSHTSQIVIIFITTIIAMILLLFDKKKKDTPANI